MRALRSAVSLLAAVCFASACTSAKEETPPGPLMGAVDLASFNRECAQVGCWLPLQFGPRLVERESVSLEERTPDDVKGAQTGWPMDRPEDKDKSEAERREDGDRVEVLCVIKGGEYSNARGDLVNDWYRVVVPEDKVEPGSQERAALAPDGRGRVAYTGISWLYLLDGRQAPPCA